jgi:hypothetical protein
MKKTFALLSLLIGFAIITLAQTESTRSLPFFDKLKVTNQVSVFLTHGDELSARILSTGISMDDVITEVTGKTLEITLRRGVYKDVTIDVFLTYSQLRDIYVSASGRLSFQDTLIGDKLVVNATTNGEINAIVDLRTLDVSADKGGLARISGKLGAYEARISTGGNLSALELQADSAFVTVSTKGIAKITAKELVEANVRTGATLTLTGSPNQKKIKTGLGATVLEQ